MIIDNFDFSRVAVQPCETDAEPIVDPDRMLALSVSGKSFQRHTGPSEIIQTPRRVKDDQPAQGDTLDVSVFATHFPPENFPGFGAAEGNDHNCYFTAREGSDNLRNSGNPGSLLAGLRAHASRLKARISGGFQVRSSAATSAAMRLASSTWPGSRLMAPTRACAPPP